MNLMKLILCMAIGYLFGCIQTAYIIGKKVKKIDIRNYGSNNAGASNVTTIMGWKYGVITALVDIFKAVIPVFLIKLIFKDSVVLPFIGGAFVIIGHIFPFYLSFRGGKGAASLVGMVLGIDFKIAIILIAAILLITLIIDYIALGTISMYLILPFSTYYFNYPLACTLMSILLAAICIKKHYVNIIRIKKGEEVGLRKVIKG